MCTSHINLVDFSVLLQLIRLNCVQQASISTRVNSCTFTRDQQICALLLHSRGDTAMPVGHMLGFAMHFYLSHIYCMML